MHNLKYFFFFFLLIFSNGIIAQHRSEKEMMVVAFAGNEPFIMDTASLTGISPEIWKDLADKLKLKYRAVFYDDVPQALAALQSGKADMVVGPVSITAERASNFRFSQPYFQSSLSIMSQENNLNIWHRVKPFFSKKFFIALCIFLFILGIVGAILWLSERKANPDQFPSKPARGIANGMWCAIVTMTTTGYGDIAPRTFWGRFTAGAWMIVSLIFATSMIAGIASILTLTGIQTSEVRTAEELNGKNIAVIKSSPAEDFVLDNGGRAVDVENLKEGYELLKGNKVQAIVFDRPQLLFFMKQHPHDDLSISTGEYNRQGYGFAFPLNAENVHALNVALLEMQESGRMQKIITHWLGKNAM